MIEDRAEFAGDLASATFVDPIELRAQVAGLLDRGDVEAAIDVLEGVVDRVHADLAHELYDQIERRGGRVLKLRALPASILTDERRAWLVKRGTTYGAVSFYDAERLTAVQVIDRMRASSPPQRILVLRCALVAGLHHWAACEALLALHDRELPQLVSYAGFLPDLHALRNALEVVGLASVWGVMRWCLVSASEGRLSTSDDPWTHAPSQPAPDVAVLVRRAIREVSEATGVARAPRLLERRYAKLSLLGTLPRRPAPLHPLRWHGQNVGGSLYRVSRSRRGRERRWRIPPVDPAVPVRSGRLVRTVADPKASPHAVVQLGNRRVLIDREAPPDGILWIDTLPRRSRAGWVSVTTGRSPDGDLARDACAHQLVRFLVLSVCARQVGDVRRMRAAIGRIAADEPTWEQIGIAASGPADRSAPTLRRAAEDLVSLVVRGEEPPAIAEVAVVLPAVADCLREASRVRLPGRDRVTRHVVEARDVIDPVIQARVFLVALAMAVECGPSVNTTNDVPWPGSSGSIRVRRRAAADRVAQSPPVALRLSGLAGLPTELAHCMRAIGFVEEVQSRAHP